MDAFDINRIEKQEIYRYLGYGKTEPDAEVQTAVDECLGQLLPSLLPREVHRVFPVEWKGRDAFSIAGMEVRSRSLAKNLRGCGEAYLLAATIGIWPDRLSARYSAERKMSCAVIVQAAGTALIEAWCDEVCRQAAKKARMEGLHTRPRFSPGYGDFDLAHQADLFRILEVPKRIGVTLTESLLMMPSKSVTAVVGLSETDTGCTLHGCETCGRAGNCSYSRI